MARSSSDLLAAGTQLGQDRVDAVLVDGAQGLRGNPQLDPAVLAGHPEAALVQVRQEAAAGLVVGMRDVVAALHALAGDLAYAGHVRTPRSAPSKVSVGGPRSPGTLGPAARPERVRGTASRQLCTRNQADS